ncbi:uncharacterized protein PADG_08417 [Paracoccidioides brasiliensis Pb18]|uniref:Uncharacterized protein n=1 Tax=Paracoccidioides brasiliensis (strain Pb18) TaxID=502780 RepID=C1GM26_PARBD|nr:uncharacterized protein PADG_08417 [Paracoccidioides brasiliensis Pb18]EEH43492.1 hypothetical protein PADG_08417 [Paracoccidioides brasiliensis Pb18]
MAPTLRPLPLGPHHPSSRPFRSSRKRVRTYREDSSDDDFSYLDDTHIYGSAGSSVLNPFHRRRPLTHRADPSVHISEPPANVSLEPSREPAFSAKVTRACSTRVKGSPSFRKSQRLTKSPSPKKQKRQAEADAAHSTPAGVILPWQQLPYHILVDIFYYSFLSSSAKSLSDVNKSVRWLLNTACLCREFFEPAITGLYYSPPLFPVSRLTGLLHLLERPQETLFTNYRNKIKRLDIPLRHHLIRHLDLEQLVSLTPQLQHLRLHGATPIAMYPLPTVKYRPHPLGKFLDALDENNIRLRSWAWNGESLLLLPHFQPRSLSAVHSRPAFSSLRSLQLVNFPLFPSTGEARATNPADENEPKPGELLASALALLPNLQELELDRCWNVDDDFLSCFNLNLQALKLINCGNVTSANLASFLIRGGQGLRTLVLEHNRCLNMSFTVDLATSCPNLQEFTLDLNFTSPNSFTHDVDPYFDELFHDSEVPSWPSSLQILKLERLRKWELSTAVLFFNKLIHSAPNLPNLRVLILSAILEVGWRDRANFRKEWVSKLERTYRRHSPPPNPNFKSMPNGINVDNHVSGCAAGSSASTNKGAHGHPVQRHSMRLAHQRSSIEISDDDRPTEVRYSNHANGYAVESGPGDKPEFIQGMCDIVEIRVDNLRPADYILTNDNFEDEEASGDEDWSGLDPEDVDGYAW